MSPVLVSNHEQRYRLERTYLSTSRLKTKSSVVNVSITNVSITQMDRSDEGCIMLTLESGDGYVL